MLKIKPYGRNIWVKPEEDDGILVMESGNKVERGLVLGVGKSVKTVKKGDTILFLGFGSEKIKVKDEEFFFVLEDDRFIRAVV